MQKFYQDSQTELRFPRPFPHKVFSVSANGIYVNVNQSHEGQGSDGVGKLTTATFLFIHGGDCEGEGISWFAVGY